MSEVEITSENFHEFFKLASENKPQPGDCLAIFKANAEFVDGQLKEDVVTKLMESKFGCQASIQILVKHAGMQYKEALRVVKEMVKDLMETSKEDVLKKPYKFIYETSYFTKKQYVPKDNPNWQLVGLKMATDDSVEVVAKEIESKIL